MTGEEQNANSIRYQERNYTQAEVEILLKLERLDEKFVQLKDLAEKYVTKEQFHPIQKLVYGLVGLILIAFAGALILLVIPPV